MRRTRRRGLHGAEDRNASEPMDDDPRWQLIAPGELVHVDAELQISRDVVLPDPPKHQLRREDLSAAVQAALHA